MRKGTGHDEPTQIYQSSQDLSRSFTAMSEYSQATLARLGKCMYALVTTLFLLAAESDSPRIIPISRPKTVENRARNHSSYLYKNAAFPEAPIVPLGLMPDVHRRPCLTLTNTVLTKRAKAKAKGKAKRKSRIRNLQVVVLFLSCTHAVQNRDMWVENRSSDSARSQEALLSTATFRHGQRVQPGHSDRSSRFLLLLFSRLSRLSGAGGPGLGLHAQSRHPRRLLRRRLRSSSTLA
jgi:hypothetical protein